MIIYRVEYQDSHSRGWAELDECTSLNEAVSQVEREGMKPHMQDADFRIIKRTITEEEVAL